MNLAKSPDITSSLVVDEVTTLKQLESLREEWNKLWLHCPDTTPFQSPAWSIAWWRQLGNGQLRVLLIRSEGKLVGLAPFYFNKGDSRAPGILSIIGTGISDYLDVLWEPAYRTILAEAIAQYLAGCTDWDRCDFQQLRAGSPLLQLQSEFNQILQSTDEICPVLQLPADVTGIAHCVPKNMVANVQYYRRRMSKDRNFQIMTGFSENSEPMLEALFDLHRARWEERHCHGALFDPHVQAFHREAARELRLSGRLRLFGLRKGERFAGVLYGFLHQRRFLFYLSGFDPAFAKFSPGTLLIAYALEHAILEGCREFDFLRGAESYKYLWGATNTGTFKVQLSRRTPD